MSKVFSVRVDDVTAGKLEALVASRGQTVSEFFAEFILAVTAAPAQPKPPAHLVEAVSNRPTLAATVAAVLRAGYNPTGHAVALGTAAKGSAVLEEVRERWLEDLAVGRPLGPMDTYEKGCLYRDLEDARRSQPGLDVGAALADLEREIF